MRSSETVETFIRALHELRENCDFGEKKNEHIRARHVVGIQDKELSRRLQWSTDLTLEEAVLMARQTEEVAEQTTQQEQQTSLSVQEVERRGHTKEGGRLQAEGTEKTAAEQRRGLEVPPLW